MEIQTLCDRFTARIGNEAGLVNWIFDIGCKQAISGITAYHIPVLQTIGQAQRSLAQMRIICLVDLFDAFMTQFICAKEHINLSEINRYNTLQSKQLKGLCDLWIKEAKKRKANKSTSFMNLQFSLFILEQKYQIRIPDNYYPKLILELGSLRRCLVHCDGRLDSTDIGNLSFKHTLQNTLGFLYPDLQAMPEEININNKEYLDVVITHTQYFISYCGGHISKPVEFN